jgi:glycerol-3-phosphate dehydrogenase
VDGLCAWTGLSAKRVNVLCERYGTRAEAIALFLSKQADQPLKSLPDYSRREIAFLCQNEGVVHLDDVILRRTMLAMLGQLTRPVLDELADIVGESLGWEGEQVQAEVARTLDLLATRHEVRL